MDPLGDRMKSYEATTKLHLPRRTYTIVRIDGRAFHTWTKKLRRPFSLALSDTMEKVSKKLFYDVSNCYVTYHQSDEISLLLWDGAKIETEPFLGGGVQKLASITASMTTAYFNKIVQTSWLPEDGAPEAPAMFDARVFTIPDPTEVANYFLWRQRDWIRNSKMMLGREHFSQRALFGLNSNEVVKKVKDDKGVDWDSLMSEFRHGLFLLRDPEDGACMRYTERLDGQNSILYDVVPRFKED